MNNKNNRAVFHAVLAAALYAVSMPMSKSLLEEITPTMLAAFLYIGAGIGMTLLRYARRNNSETALQKNDVPYAAAMALGFVTYGLSIFYYTHAQRIIGAARTSAYYAITPFIGAVLSMVILGEKPDYLFFIALVIMIIGTKPISEKKRQD